MVRSDHATVNAYLDGAIDGGWVESYEWNSGRVTVYFPEDHSHAGDSFAHEMHRMGYRLDQVNFRDRGVTFTPRRDAR